MLAFPVATILCYHEVDPPQDAHVTVPRLSAKGDGEPEMLRYTATPENFTAQLDYLQQSGYHVIPLARLVDFLEGRGEHALTWPEVEQLARDGVDVESHTLTHPFLTALDPASLDRELAGSRQEIEKHTGKPVRFLAYPYGDYNPAVMESAAHDGYDAAVTTSRGPITPEAQPLQLQRYLVHNDTTLEEFKTFLP